MDDEKTITFKRPVRAGDASYESITLREPTAGEIAKFFKASEKDGSWEGGMTLAALVAGVDIEVLRRAPASNVQEAIDFCANFLSAGPAIGETSQAG